MSQDKSLVKIDVGDLAAPATELIKKISEALGEIFKPGQIRRIAKAEADAAIIRAFAKIKIQELQRRALKRFVQEETRKQLNIENITAKAVPELSATANPKGVENDWIMHFFDKCKIISDEDMQKLWAKILAGEANVPGSFSKRTIEVVSLMSKNDANSFEKLCKFSWKIVDDCPLVFNYDNRIYEEEGIGFDVLTHLDSIGLLTFAHLAGFVRKELSKTIIVSYFGKDVKLEFQKEKDNELLIGQILLSQAGRELISVCKTQPKEGFIDYVKGKWEAEHVVVNIL